MTNNQCDGCKAGMPIENGNHINPNIPKGVYGRTHMGCTADRYVQSVPLNYDNLESLASKLKALATSGQYMAPELQPELNVRIKMLVHMIVATTT